MTNQKALESARAKAAAKDSVVMTLSTYASQLHGMADAMEKLQTQLSKSPFNPKYANGYAALTKAVVSTRTAARHVREASAEFSPSSPQNRGKA